jgi:cell division transport system permease protein
VSRHLWREVRRQLLESGAAGLVAVLLVAVATTWGGVLWSLHRFLQAELLAPHRPATIVAVARTPEAGSTALAALLARFPQITGEVAAAASVREELVRWFPELSTVLLGLDEAAFPSLLQLDVPPQQEGEAAAWLGARPEITLVANSRDWESRVRQTASRVAAVGFALAAALLLGCCVVVLLVVRLLVLAHADEIAIMRLIGAHDRDIRLPYLACGFCLGALGGLLGAGALFGLALLVADVAPGLQLAPGVLPLLPLVGGIAGALGAVLGLAALPAEP